MVGWLRCLDRGCQSFVVKRSCSLRCGVRFAPVWCLGNTSWVRHLRLHFVRAARSMRLYLVVSNVSIAVLMLGRAGFGFRSESRPWIGPHSGSTSDVYRPCPLPSYHCANSGKSTQKTDGYHLTHSTVPVSSAISAAKMAASPAYY